MPKIKNLIFDLDNTLYDFSSIWKKSNELTFNYFGYNSVVDYNDFYKMSKKINKRLIEEIKKGHRIHLRNERLNQTLSEYKIAFSNEVCDKYYKKQFEYMLDLIKKDDSVVEKLIDLKEEYNLIILTNGNSHEQRKKIKKLGFENIFKVYISEEMSISKPDSKAFLKVLNDENLKKEETMMIGDSLFYDIFPAEKLGLETCLVERKWHFDDRLRVYEGRKVKDIQQFFKLDFLHQKI